MLRSILSKIAAVLAAMPKMVLKKVLVAGEWVTRLFAEPAQPVGPSADVQEAIEASASDADDDKQLRHVAGRLVQGYELTVDDIKGMPELTLRWLKQLDRSALSRVLCSERDQLRAHMRGKALIKGVLRYEKQSIVDAELAVLELASGPAPKTLREALAERGMFA